MPGRIPRYLNLPVSLLQKNRFYEEGTNKPEFVLVEDTEWKPYQREEPPVTEYSEQVPF